MQQIVRAYALATALLTASVYDASAQIVPASLFTPGWTKTREGRQREARNWLKEVSDIDNQIPTLSPAEAAWLKVEYDDEMTRSGGAYTSRSIRAHETKEFAAREAKPVARRLVAVLTQLSASEPLPELREVTLWTELAWRVVDSDFWGNVATLGKEGIVARKGKEPQLGYQMTLLHYWATRVSEINGLIVLPFLDRQTPKR